MPEQKNYHLKCTGPALQTVERHSNDEDITLFGSCFCPFVQRAWVALEYLGIPYKVKRMKILLTQLRAHRYTVL
jgi:glutathione S-transferase